MRITTLAMIGITSTAALAAGDPPFQIQFTPLGTYATGVFDDGGCEIVSYNSTSGELFVVNGDAVAIDVLDVGTDGSLTFDRRIELAPLGVDSVQSVAVSPSPIGFGPDFDHVVAVAAVDEVDGDQGPGRILIFASGSGSLLDTFNAGPLPDMIGFSPNGRYVVSADEGEPNDDFTVDPIGGVTIVDLQAGKGGPTVRTIGFDTLDPAVVGDGIILSSPEGTTLAQALEPEYVAFSSDSTSGYVICQENNAFAKIDFSSGTWEWVRSLGFKDHAMPGNELDASNRDDAINITSWPINGIYMPDTIAMFTIDGVDYIATANEGDGRDYDGYSNEERVKDVDLDPVAFPDAESLQENENLGRIKMDASIGDVDGDGDYDVLYSFGARSMSIFDTEGGLVADTGAIMERVTADLFPDDFNSTNDENDSFDNRSDDKGPEPEGLAIGVIDDRTIAFVGLERIGGVMAFDVSDPTAPAYAGYVNTRDFAGDPLDFSAGDLAPEGLAFIAAADSPTGSPMLAVGFEVSGTARLFRIGTPCPGDLDGNGRVDSGDLGLLLGYWSGDRGGCGYGLCPGDLDGDGAVGPEDLAILIAHWGVCGDEG